MSGQPNTAGKPCAVCGKDSAGQPRVKDSRGRYYHKTCWEAAKRRLAAKAAGQAASAAQSGPSAGPSRKAPPIAAPVQGRAPAAQAKASRFASGAESEVLEELPLLDPAAPVPVAEAAPTCPACGKAMAAGAVLCVHCGFNSKTGKIVAATAPKVPQAKAVKGGSILDQGWIFGAGPALVLLVLFLIGRSGGEMAALFMGFYGLYSLAIWVWVLVRGFGENALTGVLCLCVPIYSIYFVYGVSEDTRLKYAFGANLLGVGLYGILTMSAASQGAGAFGVPGGP